MFHKNDEFQVAEDRFFTKELPDYRRAASYLKRQIRQSKIHRTPSKLQFEDKSIKFDKAHKAHREHQPNYHHQKPSHKRDMYKLTDVHKKQKNQPTHSTNPEENMFKNISVGSLQKKGKHDLKLPVLEKKNVFNQLYPQPNEPFLSASSQILEDEKNKPRIIKVPMDRLRPIRAEDLRKKFQSKFKINIENSQYPHIQEVFD